MPVRTFLFVAELVIIGSEPAPAIAARVRLLTWEIGNKIGNAGVIEK